MSHHNRSPRAFRGLCCRSVRSASTTALVATLGLAPIAQASPSAQSVIADQKAHFSKTPRAQQTDRFLIVHDTAPRAAKTAGRLLSLTRHMFYASLKNNGFELSPIDKPLVCLVFDEKQAFVRYGKDVDARDMAWSGGYYSARTNRVALYESPAYQKPEVIPDKEALNTRLSDLRHGQGSAKTARAASGQNQPLAADPGTVATLARTTHEAAHQLAFNSGLQKRGVMYPFWVSEGLATMFELNQYRALGPAAANPRRRQSLIEARDADTLKPIGDFIAATQIDTSNQRRISRAYAQAWGLFRFLLSERPEAMRHYLDRLKQAPMGRRTERALRRDFERAFGRMAEVKEAWQRWLARLD
jgi:hypothetical protein